MIAPVGATGYSANPLQTLMTEVGAVVQAFTGVGDSASVSEEAGQEGPDYGTANPLVSGLQDYGQAVRDQQQQNTSGLTDTWAQGKEGNCASVATIKAAMSADNGQVFNGVQHDKNGYTVSLQDGSTTHVSNQEYQQAQQQSNFTGPNSGAKNEATLAFATMAKRDQQMHHESSYGTALHDLNNGQNPYNTAQDLGIEHSLAASSPNQAGTQGATVAWNSDHAIYVHNGVADHYGQSEQYNGTDTRGNQITNAFTVLPRA